MKARFVRLLILSCLSLPLLSQDIDWPPLGAKWYYNQDEFGPQNDRIYITIENQMDSLASLDSIKTLIYTTYRLGKNGDTIT